MEITHQPWCISSVALGMDPPLDGIKMVKNSMFLAALSATDLMCCAPVPDFHCLGSALGLPIWDIFRKLWKFQTKAQAVVSLTAFISQFAFLSDCNSYWDFWLPRERVKKKRKKESRHLIIDQKWDYTVSQPSPSQNATKEIANHLEKRKENSVYQTWCSVWMRCLYFI